MPLPGARDGVLGSSSRYGTVSSSTCVTDPSPGSPHDVSSQQDDDAPRDAGASAPAGSRHFSLARSATSPRRPPRRRGGRCTRRRRGGCAPSAPRCSARARCPCPTFWPPARANRSKIRVRSAGATPGPWSSTWMSTNAPRSRTRTPVRPPPCRSALRNRFVRARTNCGRSTSTSGSADPAPPAPGGRAGRSPASSAWCTSSRAPITACVILVRAGVQPAQREEVFQRSAEPGQLVGHQLDGAGSARGERSVASLEQAEAGGQGGHGRAQLVADVGGEPRVLLDPVVQCVDHVVERRRRARPGRGRRCR